MATNDKDFFFQESCHVENVFFCEQHCNVLSIKNDCLSWLELIIKTSIVIAISDTNYHTTGRFSKKVSVKIC